MKKRLNVIFAYLKYWIHRYGPVLLPISAGILSLLSTHILFGPVLNRSGDNIYHLMNEYVLVNGILAGDNVFGPLGLEMGQPILRFYQSLFYLFNAAVHLLTGADIRLVHNVTLCLCFALSPLSFYYFMRKLRINRWAAGVASYLTLISIAAFGNSYEAFFQAGIVTQAMGGVFFPWFMGVFIGMLRGENSPLTAGLLFALAFLSHAIMAVYATFVGALYYLMSESDIRHNFKKLVVFAATGGALVAFWVVPFIEHNSSMRPVPDPVFRGGGVHWYTSVSTGELVDVATQGYLLDDARAKGDARNETEKLMDKISIISSQSHRPPVLTGLVALGILVALFRLRRLSVRFLLGGFVFSLMLFAGPDDFPWLSYLPFIDNIQGFRCTYLIEIFAFGLAALVVEATFGMTYTAIRKRRRLWIKAPLFVVWLGVVGCAIGWVGNENVKLGQTHLVIRKPNILNQDLDALQNVPDAGYPFKVEVRTDGRPKIRHAWFAMNGFMPYCTHWKGTGPETAYKLCQKLGDPHRHNALYAMAGIRWFTGWGPKIAPLKDAVDEDGVPVLHQIPTGKDRTGRLNTSRTTLDNGFEHFLRPYIASPVPVICNDKQWLWLTTNWLGRYRTRLFSPDLPLITRVEAGALARSDLLARARGVLYLDHQAVSADIPALQAFVHAGGTVVSPLEIEGVEASLVAPMKSPWESLPPALFAARTDLLGRTEREEIDPGIEVADISYISPNRLTYQRFAFDVEALHPVMAILPLQNYPGWKAYLNGKEQQVFSTGPDLVGVPVPKGVHRLRFAWEMPARHRATLILSLLALCVVLGVWSRRVFKCIRDPRYIPEY